MSEAAGSQRIDRWLWFARFFRSRTMASKFVAAGRVRVNAERVEKAHHGLRAGDVLTFAQGSQVRVVRVVGLGARRGPAPEARLLYDDLEPAVPRPAAEAPPETLAPAVRSAGTGRPTKAERRATDRLRGDG